MNSHWLNVDCRSVYFYICQSFVRFSVNHQCCENSLAKLKHCKSTSLALFAPEAHLIHNFRDTPHQSKGNNVTHAPY